MKEYLLDTNILIYLFADTIPKKEVNKIEEIFRYKKTF
jgi:predicted nucleic acid-binding protein